VESEGELIAAIRRCHEMLNEMGVPHIHRDFKLGTRMDRPQSMADEIASVKGRLAGA
jgi:uncharacterized protein YqgV (UPF0045/DUF77 family)